MNKHAHNKHHMKTGARENTNKFLKLLVNTQMNQEKKLKEY